MRNTFDAILARLAAAARKAEPAPAAEPPPYLATRVLATLRERAHDRFWWEAMARHTAVTACIVAAVAWFVRPAPPPAAEENPDDLAAAFVFSGLEP